MNNNLLNISFVIILILLIVVLFIKIVLRIRKYGGSLTTTMFASTYEFLNKDKREAVGEIVEMKANKKLEEDESDEL